MTQNESPNTQKKQRFSISGVLEIHRKGFGFLRSKKNFYSEKPEDPFVPFDIIKKRGLKPGTFIEGQGETGKTGNAVLKFIDKVNGQPLSSRNRQDNLFFRLTSVSPNERIKLELKDGPISMRIIDILCPLGKGSRSLIISPPKVGKTTFLKEIANSIHINHPEIEIITLLVDERPEEVTDMMRSVHGEVIASSMDQSLYNHTRICRLTIEMARRKAEAGKDVLILMDSITRMSRAFNTMEGDSGRTLSGGLDAYAMDFPRTFFGSARKLERGGSLTIIATCLVDTGSRMDELIYREFQGTGNQEVRLSRKLSDKRIFPAIDLEKSRTRREELLLDRAELTASTRIRKGLFDLRPDISMERLIETMQKFPDNATFVEMLISAKI